MGVKSRTSSEYQRSFKSKYPCATTIYEGNVDFRIRQREHEYQHHVDPFLWDNESSTDSDRSNSNVGKEPKRPTSVPKHIYKHEKFNRAYRDTLNKLTQKLEQNLHLSATQPVAPPVEQRVVKTCNEAAQTDSVVTVDRAVNGDVVISPGDEYPPLAVPKKRSEEKTKPIACKEAVEAKPVSRPRITRPCSKVSIPKPKKSQHKPLPKPRPLSAPLGHPLKKDDPDPECEGEKPPFVSYGCQDKELCTGTRKTYNVRASADIFPSALRAMKRRQTQIAAHEKLAKSAPLAEKRRHACFNEFNERVRRETSQWSTEYRSHFAGYERAVYQQSLSARPVSRHQDAELLAATL